ncbi:STAS domain-containing protein [Actinokineospora bangkokensis]|nr:STAS domain-containing protein [Actinokineospora bangkokensis]
MTSSFLAEAKAPCVVVGGEVDVSNAQELRESLEAALRRVDRHESLVVDLLGVDLLACAGAREIRRFCARCLEAGVVMTIRARAGGTVAEVLRVAGLADLLG